MSLESNVTLSPLNDISCTVKFCEPQTKRVNIFEIVMYASFIEMGHEMELSNNKD